MPKFLDLLALCAIPLFIMYKYFEAKWYKNTIAPIPIHKFLTIPIMFPSLGMLAYYTIFRKTPGILPSIFIGIGYMILIVASYAFI